MMVTTKEHHHKDHLIVHIVDNNISVEEYDPSSSDDVITSPINCPTNIIFQPFSHIYAATYDLAVVFHLH